MFSRHPHRRPPSYSDSFVFSSLNGDPPFLTSATSYPGLLDTDPHDPLLRPAPISTRNIPVQEEAALSTTDDPLPLAPNRPNPLRRNESDAQFSTFSIPAGFSPAEKWSTRFLGFGVHLSLVSLFETLFFFLFISKSEDAGLENMINNYITGVLTTCNTWPANTTAVVNDILSVLINKNQTLALAAQAATTRAAFNHTLFVQAWLYVAGLASLVALGTTASLCTRTRIAWGRVLVENFIMVSLLGLYELTFFKTIIYNYENISLPELDGNIVTQLNAQCGLLSSHEQPQL
jgi:hypothetical protein